MGEGPIEGQQKVYSAIERPLSARWLYSRSWPFREVRDSPLLGGRRRLAPSAGSLPAHVVIALTEPSREFGTGSGSTYRARA